MKKIFPILMLLVGLVLTALPTEARSLSGNVANWNLTKRVEVAKSLRKGAPRQNVMFKASGVDVDALEALPLVTEVTGGESKMYSRSSDYYGVYSGQLYADYDLGFAAEVVTKDDKVYFKNPYATLPTNSYLEGTLADSKVTVSFPQKIYLEDYYDEYYQPATETYYAVKLVLTQTQGGTAMIVDYDNPTIEFTVTENGYEMLGEGAYIGLVYLDQDMAGNPEFAWTGLADTNQVLTLCTDTPLTIPADMTAEDWMFKSYEEARLIKVAVNDTEVYVAGLFAELPDAAVKGKIENGKVVFTSGAYLGDSKKYGHLVYALFGIYQIDGNGEITDVNMANELSYTYNAEKKELIGPRNNLLVFSSVPDDIYMIDYYTDIEIAWQDFSAPMTPSNPQMLVYEYIDQAGFGAMAFMLPLTSVDGRILNSENGYYNIYIDDKILTLYPAEYMFLDGPMTDISFDYSDSYDIYSDGPQYREMVIYATGFEKIGVRALYKNENGETTYSGIAYNDGDGVEKTMMESSVSSTKMYDLNGMEINRPAKGTIVVRIDKMDDGSVKATKSVVR